MTSQRPMIDGSNGGTTLRRRPIAADLGQAVYAHRQPGTWNFWLRQGPVDWREYEAAERCAGPSREANRAA
jgi:hypothetical protein